MNETVSPQDGVKKTAALIKGVGLAVIISATALAVLAAVMLFGGVPEWLMGPAAIAASLISVFLGAVSTVKKIGEKGWLWGAVCGGIYYAIVYMCALAAMGEFNFSLKTALMILIGIFVGAVGGIFAVNSSQTRRRR